MSVNSAHVLLGLCLICVYVLHETLSEINDVCVPLDGAVAHIF